jgi:hypothetical protein
MVREKLIETRKARIYFKNTVRMEAVKEEKTPHYDGGGEEK